MHVAMSPEPNRFGVGKLALFVSLIVVGISAPLVATHLVDAVQIGQPPVGVGGTGSAEKDTEADTSDEKRPAADDDKGDDGEQPAPTRLTSPPLKEGAVLAESIAGVDECFATSLVCAYCHSNTAQADAMRDSEHSPISPFHLWESSMMANSTRDPLWRAAVSMEVALHPQHKKKIEAKCTRCHAPMASVERQHSLDVSSMDEIYNPKAKHNQLALDGVSCAACHQIDPENLGKKESFSGGFQIYPGKKIYGPHANPAPQPMTQFSGGFNPNQSDHVMKSSLCGTCHTLYTNPIAADGTMTDQEFPEQTPYLEWRNSIYSNEENPDNPNAKTCQDCHMPKTDTAGKKIKTRIARNPGGRDFRIQDREPYGRHIFVGGNTLIPAILRDNAHALGVTVPGHAFDATIEAAKDQLANKTAKVEIVDLKRTKDTLSFGVRVENLTGHKLPTAHPTRRSWIKVQVEDLSETIRFRSGGYDEAGRLVDGTGEVLATEKRGGGYLAHRDVIDSDKQVQVYEAILGDLGGKHTYSLMSAASYLKDNRLLPKGWRADHPDAKDTAPVGTASDANFTDGSDTTYYKVALPGRTRVVVHVTLLHQTLGARYATEMFAHDTKAIKEFQGYYENADRTPDRMGEVSLEVEPAG